MIQLTSSIASSSKAFWCRSTVKVNRGGTNSQLNASTASALDAMLAQGGSQIDASAEASTSSIAWLARSSRPLSQSMPAQPAAQASPARASCPPGLAFREGLAVCCISAG